jgi:hypothetical protein
MYWFQQNFMGTIDTKRQFTSHCHDQILLFNTEFITKALLLPWIFIRYKEYYCLCHNKYINKAKYVFSCCVSNYQTSVGDINSTNLLVMFVLFIFRFHIAHFKGFILSVQAFYIVFVVFWIYLNVLFGIDLSVFIVNFQFYLGGYSLLCSMPPDSC